MTINSRRPTVSLAAAAPLITAADMDIRRVRRVIADAKRFGVKEILLAAFRIQMEGLLMELFPRDGMIARLSIEQPVLDAAFGKDFSLYSMENKGKGCDLNA